jgi:hypothetical protein
MQNKLQSNRIAISFSREWATDIPVRGNAYGPKNSEPAIATAKSRRRFVIRYRFEERAKNDQQPVPSELEYSLSN